MTKKVKKGARRRAQPGKNVQAGNNSKSRAPEKSVSLPIVGIGASAGGLEALRTLFAKFDGPTGIAFVIVQHMAPKYRSMLAELLGRDAHLSVKEIEQDEEPVANVVYVTPPNADIVLEEGRLHLVEPDERIGPKPSVDRFFSSLALQLDGRCGGVILSGTGSDGANGVRAIKEAGGFVIAQTPETAKYDGMPRAAIATGCVDLVMSPTEIAERLAGVVQKMVDAPGRGDADDADSAYKVIFDAVREATRVNLNLYKPNTIRRRLERRMHATRMATLEEYAHLVRNHPAEAERLFRDAMIGVTSFFRDRELFATLTDQIEALAARKPPGEPIRIWSAGCSTGEEPYSLAILFSKALKALGSKRVLQIFATDVSEEGMATARRGIYPKSALRHLAQEDIDAYFVAQDDKLQVKKQLRESVVFARHDLTQDPPFLKMDLIACRNVFIYFDPEVQDRIIKMFHYALNPDGLMFLGKSESIGSLKSFFAPVDPAAKIYRRNDRATDPGVTFTRPLHARQDAAVAMPPKRERPQANVLSDVIRAFAPHSLVVDEALTVVAVHGNAQSFLRIPDGVMQPSLDMLLHSDIKNKILTLAHRARRNKEVSHGGTVQVAGQTAQASVYPVATQGEQRYVLSFRIVTDDGAPLRQESSSGQGGATEREVDELERELAATREHLQTVIEEQETSNEELQALNEELQSANEELQSTNEELETSNEELQSTNEELTTLNEELNVKSTELVELSNHLTAIQDAVPHPILVVDHNFNLVRCNQAVEKTLGLSADDLQRNLRLLPQFSKLTAIVDAAERCLKQTRTINQQVRTDDLDYDVKCEPVRDHKDETIGVVLTLVDNSELSSNLRKAQAAESSLIEILSHIPAAVSVKDAAGRYRFVNEEFERLIRPAMKVLGKTDEEVFGPEVGTEIRSRDLETLKRRTVQRMEESVEAVDGKRHVVLSSRMPLVGADGTVASVCAVAIDVTERAEAARRLQLFKEVITSSKEGLLVFEEGADDEFRVTVASVSFEAIAGLRASELPGRTVREILTLLSPGASSRALPPLNKVQGNDRLTFEVRDVKDGIERTFEIRLSIFQPRNASRQLLMIVLDNTEKKEQERVIRSQQDEILRAGKLASLGEMAAGIAHELNTPLNTIQGHVDLVRQSCDGTIELPEVITRSLNTIEATVEKISDIIVGLKSIARSAPEREMQACKIDDLIQEVMTLCELHLRHRGVRLDLDLANGELAVRGYPTQLMQVLINLVNNAVDAVRRLDEKWVRIRTEDLGDEVLIQVVDSGEGIPAQLAERVMTPFFTTKQDGTGLGLSLSRSIVRAHQGDIVINRAHKNTCFEVRLPKKSAPSA